MNFSWQVFVDLGIVSLALLLATFIRSRVRFFQKYLIPNSLTAGFMLLAFYNFAAPRLGLNAEGLKSLVYHLLSLSFVAMSLRKSSSRASGKNIFSNSLAVVTQFTLQGLTGIALTFFFIITFLPDLFPSIGFFIPLGFGLGPGQAFAMGKGWESFGFAGAGDVGLTFAAMGFIWACFGGVFLINLGIRRGWMDRRYAELFRSKGVRTGVYAPEADKPVGARLTTESEAIDSMSYNLAVVFGVYLLAYLFLQLITFLLAFLGPLGTDLAVNLWGISFVFAAVLALLVKKLFGGFKILHTLDNGSLTRIAGASVDIMVAAAVGAISLVVVSRYWLPILVMGLVGGLVATVSVLWMVPRLFRDHQFHRAVMIYGAVTGTISTGLALLRVIDREFETPAASDYMYSTGITFVLSIPFILTLNLPAYAFRGGNPLLYWLTLGVFALYLVLVLVAYQLISKERAFAQPRRLWVKLGLDLEE
jgi:ESS family glutamate:Na+ symporter